ncbi:MAG: 2-C-methyl-D-erythritol 2,4-cyclodiphosphate synthase [Thermoanaerobaculia bacterium]|nr:2-C-methyl-D-erythritol 2,4-cyclodiphosphate synthase [Thermoanaerobaculia bacterium]
MIRTGQGVDVHRFNDDRPLVLGGVRISERGGLDGHSDADAVLHALTDALLGAIAAGDIGEHFPSSDERWRNAPSSRFIERACNLIFGQEGHVLSVDITIIAARPKLAPHRQAMRSSIADLLGIPLDRVSVKATTTDGLGFTGRGEGICSMAVVTVETP